MLLLSVFFSHRSGSVFSTFSTQLRRVYFLTFDRTCDTEAREVQKQCNIWVSIDETGIVGVSAEGRCRHTGDGHHPCPLDLYLWAQKPNHAVHGWGLRNLPSSQSRFRVRPYNLFKPEGLEGENVRCRSPLSPIIVKCLTSTHGMTDDRFELS